MRWLDRGTVYVALGGECFLLSFPLLYADGLVNAVLVDKYRGRHCPNIWSLLFTRK